MLQEASAYAFEAKGYCIRVSHTPDEGLLAVVERTRLIVERRSVPVRLEEEQRDRHRVSRRAASTEVTEAGVDGIGDMVPVVRRVDILAVPAPTYPLSMISQSLRHRENSRREVDLATNTTVAGRRGQAVCVLAGTGGVLRLEAAESDGARVVNGLVVLAEHRVTGDHAEALQQQLVTIEVLCAREDLTLGNAVTLPTWM